MGVVQRFERRLEGLVEGTFARVFKGEIHPTEIAAALQRETDDRRAIVSEERVLVPNDFVVELGPRDHDRLAPYADPLAEELGAMIREHAEEAGYSFVGPVRIGFELVQDLDTGIFRIRSEAVAGAQVSGGIVTTTQAAPGDQAPAPATGLRGNPRLLLNPESVGISSPAARGRQQVFPLAERLTIGRGADCDLQLSDPGVSRRHAMIRCKDDVFIIEDLDSTNGTLVNNLPIGDRQLAPGDRIRLGSTTLVFERDVEG